MAMEQRRYRLPPFGSSAPLVPFASFPAALTVEGQIRRPEELPHVSLIALGGLWRPLGGRQVLRSRYVNPITTQDLSDIKAEVIGPFPGGLVRANMQLRLNWTFGVPGFGTGVRRVRASLGSIGHATLSGTAIQSVAFQTSNIYGSGWMDTYVNAISDTNAAHGLPGPAVAGGVTPLTNGHLSAPSSQLLSSADFSAAWEIGLWCTSAAETATNITSVSWSGGVATFVNPTHTLNTGDKTTVAGVSNAGYNGVYTGITRIDANTWSGTLVADPGGAGTGGTSSRISPVTSQSYSLELWG